MLYAKNISDKAKNVLILSEEIVNPLRFRRNGALLRIIKHFDQNLTDCDPSLVVRTQKQKFISSRLLSMMK